MNKQDNRSDADYTTAPIRTYAEVVAAMRAKGDATITIQHIHWYEQSAFRKLRKMLGDLKTFTQETRSEL